MSSGFAIRSRLSQVDRDRFFKKQRCLSYGNRLEVEALQAVLDDGEAEVIALGQELQAQLVLLDNREPRLFAKKVGLPVM